MIVVGWASSAPQRVGATYVDERAPHFLTSQEEHSAIASSAAGALKQAAALLEVEQPEDLSTALCTRRLVTRDDVITVPLNTEQALDSREALTKAIYGRQV